VTRDRRQWILELPRFREELAPLWTIVVELGVRARFFTEADRASLRLLRAYCNAVHFGDQLYVHRDCDADEDHTTALLYANAVWQRDWGGETLFFDEDHEAVAAISPRPGRIVLFDGRIPHRAGAPMRDCHESRFTVAVKIASR
jgi:Rps23 Pro-64 3,4-dihydroxylase Tpa1-like proline 4-hydroxylase